SFNFYSKQMIIFVGTGITVCGFFATCIEPKYPSGAGGFNIAKYGFIIFQTINLYALLQNILIDVSGFPIADVQLSLSISVQLLFPYLYGTLVIGGQLLNIGRFSFQVFFGTQLAERDHHMLPKKNQEVVHLKNDTLALIEIDEPEEPEEDKKSKKVKK
ncbi:MAG: hypothetical protein ACTSVY_09845, partial [Candidatus Helarchaeota archaeon]